MSNVNSQNLSEQATLPILILRSTYAVVPRPREHEIYEDFSIESRSTNRLGFIEQPVIYLHHISEYVSKHNKIYPCILKAGVKYDERIDFLEEEGSLDGVTLNPESKYGFKEFIKQCIPTISGGLVLNDNGNLRAVWNSDGESFVGLQFLNHQVIEYVLFSQTDSSLPVSRSFGQANINSVMNQIKALELNWMLYEQR